MPDDQRPARGRPSFSARHRTLGLVGGLFQAAGVVILIIVVVSVIVGVLAWLF